MPKVITATPSTLRCSMRRISASVRAGIVVRRSDHHFIALRHGQVLELLHQLREKMDW